MADRAGFTAALASALAAGPGTTLAAAFTLGVAWRSGAVVTGLLLAALVLLGRGLAQPQWPARVIALVFAALLLLEACNSRWVTPATGCARPQTTRVARAPPKCWQCTFSRWQPARRAWQVPGCAAHAMLRSVPLTARHRMRLFNPEGPNRPELHYTVPPLTRWDMEAVLELIEQQKYFP